MNNKILSTIFVFFQLSLLSQFEIEKCVKFLASDSLEGRMSGTIGEKIAAEYIVKEFKKNKLKVIKDTFSFIYLEKKYSTQNIVAKSKFKKKRKTVLILAHYDHLGFGEHKSYDFSKNKIHNGADDNASGVALMLDIASKYRDLNFNFIFVGLSGHELGLYGSKDYYMKNLELLQNVKLVVNFDMVGRLNNENKNLYININEKSKNIYKILNKTIEKYDLNPIYDTINVLNLDSKIFSENKIPTINFTTGLHDDYHKSSDDFEKINVNGIIAISEFIFNFLKNIEKETE